MGTKLLTRRRRDDSGAAALEFALIAPLLLLLTLATVQFGLIMQAQLAIANAAGEGARLAAITPITADNVDAWRSVVEEAAFPLSTDSGLQISPDYASVPGEVVVNVSYPVGGDDVPNLIFVNLPENWWQLEGQTTNWFLRGKATMRVQFTY